VTEVVIAFKAGRAWREHQHTAKRAPDRRYPARIARQLGFTRARVTRLMDLLLLAPEVQEEILFLELPPGAQPVSERGLREAVLGTIDWQEQRRRWEGLRAQFGPAMQNEH
jgi:hypothetical protein